MIELNHVCFSYGSIAVLRDFSLRIDAGERVAVHGTSGCGKTTLLRLILGLEQPQSGTVTMDAERTAVLFQEDRLLPYLSVARNCALFAQSPVAPMLQALGLADAAEALPSALSGGMARRAALARALCHDAALYLFDEPFNGLDEESATRCAEQINRVTAGKTVLVVTHHDDEAEALGCRRELRLG